MHAARIRSEGNVGIECTITDADRTTEAAYSAALLKSAIVEVCTARDGDNPRIIENSSATIGAAIMIEYAVGDVNGSDLVADATFLRGD